MLEVTTLEIDCKEPTCVKVWVKCRSVDDVNELITWLEIAKRAMLEWESISREDKPLRVLRSPLKS